MISFPVLIIAGPAPLNCEWGLPLDSCEQQEAEGAKARASVCEIQLSQALKHSEFTDMSFEIGGVKVASGHRGVLSARSPVFDRMFSSDTAERLTGVVKLKDVTADGLLLFLEFIYLGAISPFFSSTPSLKLCSFLRLCILENSHKH